MFNNWQQQTQPFGTGATPYPSQYPPYPSQSGITSNIVRVTSLEEAIMRTNQRGSDMLYIHQDKDIVYRVKVDFDGKKSWGEFPILVPNQSDNIPATKADIEALASRISALEAKSEPVEVVENGKSV